MNTQEPALIEKLAISFISKTPHLFWMVDEDGSLVYANKPFYTYFGIGEEALQKKIVDLLPKEVGGALYQDHLQVLQTNAPLFKEQRVKWADGTSLVFLINLFPVRLTYRRPISFSARSCPKRLLPACCKSGPERNMASAIDQR